MAIHLILGGARSGKSRFAESLANASDQVVYVATAQADDKEMQQRIQQHQQDRPAAWQTLEVGQDLAEALENVAEQKLIIVDCLTLWLMGCFQNHPQIEYQPMNRFMKLIENWSQHHSQHKLVLVSNEISMGVVPIGELNRDYVDTLGRLHQHIAHYADEVTLMVAGIPMPVKQKA